MRQYHDISKAATLEELREHVIFAIDIMAHGRVSEALEILEMATGHRANVQAEYAGEGKKP